MRILDIEDNELQEEELNLELGYLEPDRVFIQHHDAIEGQKRQVHYTVKNFWFDDGTSYEPTGEDDPHIEIQDAKEGLFWYIPAEGEEERKLRNINLEEIEDAPAVKPQEAWDEYEDIQRYKFYTEEELAERAEEAARQAEEEAKAAEREEFLETAPERLNSTEADVEDLILIMADLVGTEE